jgi:DNA-binding transcriptional ArsR family regulator
LDKNTELELKELSDVEWRVIKILAPRLSEDGKEYPELNVTTIAELAENARPYISNVLNQLKEDGIVEMRKRNASHLFRLCDDEKLGLIAYRLQRRQEDIDEIEDFLAEDIATETLLEPDSPFMAQNLNFYISGAEKKDSIKSTKVPQEKVEEILDSDDVNLAKLIHLVTTTLRDEFEDVWKEELNRRYDRLLDNEWDEDSAEKAKEVRDAVIEAIWDNQVFEAETKTLGGKAHTRVLPSSPETEDFEDSWEIVSGLCEPEVFRKLKQMDNPEKFINRFGEEVKEVREYKVTISERHNE